MIIDGLDTELREHVHHLTLESFHVARDEVTERMIKLEKYNFDHPGKLIIMN